MARSNVRLYIMTMNFNFYRGVMWNLWSKMKIGTNTNNTWKLESATVEGFSSSFRMNRTVRNYFDSI